MTSPRSTPERPPDPTGPRPHGADPSSAVPLIDLGDYLRGVPEGVQRIATEVRAAAETHGCFQLVGHGVSRSFLQRVHDASRAFFDLPPFDKLMVAEPAPGAERGWAELDAPDGVRIEKFDMGPPEVVADRYHSSEPAGTYFAPNLWPTDPAELRDLWIRYYLTMAELSRQLMSIIAVSLRLDADYFEHEIDHQISVLRAVDLSGPPSTSVPRRLRSGPSSDFGSLTIVHQANRSIGLQVRGQQGGWHDVSRVDGGLVVAIGDLLAERTSGRWRATTHRFVGPAVTSLHEGASLASASEGVSLVFCHQPNYDAQVGCIPSCLPSSGPPAFGSVPSGVYLQRKIAGGSADRRGPAETVC